MDDLILSSLKDLPFALLFALFLILSFRQRQATMVMMADIVKSFTKVIAKCCDDEELDES